MMIDELVSSARAEMVRLDGLVPGWTAGLLAKAIYEVPPDRRPVPDGLSRDYLLLAAEEGAIDRAAGAAGRAVATGGLLVWVEGLLQAEIARAVVLEDDLLQRAVAERSRA